MNINAGIARELVGMARELVGASRRVDGSDGAQLKEFCDRNGYTLDGSADGGYAVGTPFGRIEIRARLEGDRTVYDVSCDSYGAEGCPSMGDAVRKISDNAVFYLQKGFFKGIVGDFRQKLDSCCDDIEYSEENDSPVIVGCVKSRPEVVFAFGYDMGDRKRRTNIELKTSTDGFYAGEDIGRGQLPSKENFIQV